MNDMSLPLYYLYVRVLKHNHTLKVLKAYENRYTIISVAPPQNIKDFTMLSGNVQRYELEPDDDTL